VRSNNEDAFYIAPALDLFLVADGLGGHAGGETASQTVVDIVAAAQESTSAWGDPAVELASLLRQADLAVRQKAIGELHNMGSTVVAMFLREDSFWIAHAGDSRAYLLRSGRLERLTIDHTPEQEDGIGLPAPYRSGMITRAIGIGDDTLFDLDEGSSQKGDRFLLCSDGLTDAIPEKEIATLLKSLPDPATVVERLVAAANEAGGPDNITVVVVAVQ
jgi:serine/threonine protein phosphatase PrpC